MTNFFVNLKLWDKILASTIIAWIVSHTTTFTSSISINKSRDLPKSIANFTFVWGDKLLMVNNKKVLLNVDLKSFVIRSF